MFYAYRDHIPFRHLERQPLHLLKDICLLYKLQDTNLSYDLHTRDRFYYLYASLKVQTLKSRSMDLHHNIQFNIFSIQVNI